MAVVITFVDSYFYTWQ